MATAFADAVAFTISNTPGSSLGFTYSAVLTGGGFLTPTQGGCVNGESYRLFIREPSNGNMEIRDGCVYNSGTGAFTRGTLRRSTTGSAITFTSAAIVNVIAASARDLQALEDLRIASLRGLTTSFRVPTAFRAWQGACWWDGRVILTSDRDSAFAISNTVGVYNVSGKLLFELPNAYTAVDGGGKKYSFGSPYIHSGFLYVGAYNFNDGGSPLSSRVVRYTLDPVTSAVALDTSFGTGGAVDIGGDVVEQVARVNGEWWACYFDATYVRRFNDSWTSLGTVALSQPYPASGGPEAMIWEDNDTTVYFVMHGPNAFGAARSSEIHKYTRSGTTLTYVTTLTAPGYGLTQGASAAPLGYVWADRPGNRVWFTPDLIETPLRSHSPRANRVDLFKPTLVNSWVGFDATYDRTARAYFDIQSGRVYLEGMIAGGSTTPSSTIFNLPSYMAPRFSKNFPAIAADAAAGVGVVGKEKGSGTTGDVIFRFGSNTWLSLDGVSWLTDD